MKVAVYQRVEKTFTTLFEVDNPFFRGSSLVFENGQMDGLNEFHIFLEDDETPPETWEEAKLIDKRDTIPVKKTLQEENAELKSRLESTEMAMITLMDFV